MVKLGVPPPLLPGLADSGPFMRDYAAMLEGCGIESLWRVEHGPRGGGRQSMLLIRICSKGAQPLGS